MFCGNCGTENPDDSVFCENCGARLYEESEGTTRCPKNTQRDAPKTYNDMPQKYTIIIDEAPDFLYS